MKIAFIIYNPFSLGGVQRATTIIANQLQEQGNQIYILCDTIEKKSLYNLNKNIKVSLITTYGFFDKIKLFITNKMINIFYKTNIFNNRCNLIKFLFYKKNNKKIKALIDIIKKEKIDVIVGVGGSNSIYAAIIKEKIEVKAIGWQHSNCYAYFEKKNTQFYKQEKVVFSYLRKLDAYIVLTNDDRDWLKKHAKLDAITIGNPLSFNDENSKKTYSKTFLSAGRLVEIKGFDKLIRSFSIFCKQNDDWNLIIVGDGPEREKLKTMVNSLNLQNRITLAHQTNDIKKYYSTAGIYLLTSLYEGLPMVVLESFSMSLPVISYDILGIKDLISNGVEGILVEKYNEEEFASQMLYYSNHLEDVVEMGKKAKEKSKLYSCDNILRKWNHLLEEIKNDKQNN